MTLRPGTLLLDRYEIRAMVEEGAWGACWLATDRRFGRDVDVRSISLPDARSEFAMAEFHRRTSALAAQLHPRIQTLLDVAIEAPLAHIIAIPTHGRSLEEHLWHGSLSWPEGKKVLEGVLSLLEIAHAKALPHLRLTPAAVMIAPDGAIGLRHFSQGPGDVLPQSDPHVDPSGMSGEGGPSADLFACGALVADLLGHDPTRWPDEARQVHRLLTQTERHLRPASARAARALLAPPPQAVGPFSMRRWRWIAVLLAAGALTGLGAWRFRSSNVLPSELEPSVRTPYLLAREHIARRGGDDLEKAEQLYSEVLRQAPSCSEAWSGAAVDQALLGVYGLRPRTQALAQAREFARRALAIDPQNGEAMAVQAYVEFRYEWNWVSAEATFRRAIAAQPQDALIRHWWGFFLSLSGRHAEAIEQLELAHRLNPVDRQVDTNRAVARMWAGDVDGGIHIIQESLFHDPHFESARSRLRLAYEAEGRIPEALAETKQMVRHGVEPEARYAELLAAYRKGGSKAYFRTEAKLLAVPPPRGEVHYVYLAQSLALMGDPDGAFQALNEAVEHKNLFTVWVPQDPAFLSLRKDPRWKGFLKRIHYPGAS